MPVVRSSLALYAEVPPHIESNSHMLSGDIAKYQNDVATSDAIYLSVWARITEGKDIVF